MDSYYRDNVPIDEYHADSAISSSGLKVLHSECPRIYWEQFEAPDREKRQATDAMVLGNAVHAAILEPEIYAVSYAIAPKVDRRTKAGKAAFADFQVANIGKTILTEDQGQVIQGICNEFRTSKDESARLARALLLEQEGANERSVWWTDSETGLACRCRPDRWLADGSIVSFKTTKDASPRGFAREIAQFQYHMAEAFYLDGCEAATGERPPSTWFVAAQTSPPFLIGVYLADEEMITVGESDYRAALRRLAHCRQKGVWPGHAVGRINLPAWRVAESIEANYAFSS